MLKVVTEFLSYIVIVQLFLFLDLDSFFGVLLHWFCLIVLYSTCTFLASEMELFMGVVNDVNSVTISMESSLLGSEIQYLLLLLFTVTVITYRDWH